MEYVARIDGLLEASLGREALAEEDKKCRHCVKGFSAVWRCKDCSMGIPMCRGCIRSYHNISPFHRIEKWNGNYFRPAEMWEVGTYLLVRHHGNDGVCDTLVKKERVLGQLEEMNDQVEQETLIKNQAPAPAPVQESAFGWAGAYDYPDNDVEMSNPEEVTDDVGEEDFIRYIQELQDQGGDSTMSAEDGPIGAEEANLQYGGEIEDDVEEEEIKDPTLKHYLPEEINIEDETGNSTPQRLMGSYVRVVHTTGIHNIAMITCECRGHDNLPSDFVAARLLPASFERIRTLFTAQLLDHFRLCNLELKATAYQFYHLLQRLTSPMHPAEVVNLYRELRRMSRIWRWMKRLKWAGYGNKNKAASEVDAGELTVFCPACPQPGINIPDNWKEDKARHVVNILYIISY